ncbi:MAG TPA: PhzF family phenazine biosynthesis protein [Halomicronema sp.]
MTIPLIQIDAFTNQPFTGNPAAVCILKEPASEDWMQNVAAEMNLSETAFLYPQDEGFNLRWFTPAIEVDLCGHATLASAHALWELGYLKPQETAKFYTRSGLLTAIFKDNWIELNFPATPTQTAPAPANLSQALGVDLKSVSKNQFDYLVTVDEEKTLRQMQPDFNLLKTIPMRGIIVTSLADSEQYDFVSRFFAPAAGINEDPVTGSAHCSLAPFWAKQLNKTKFLAYQASARGGIVRVSLQENRVFIGGQAVTVLRGELT